LFELGLAIITLYALCLYTVVQRGSNFCQQLWQIVTNFNRFGVQ